MRTKNIDAQRKQLASWRATIALYCQQYASEIEPLAQAFDDHRVKLVHHNAQLSHSCLVQTPDS